MLDHMCELDARRDADLAEDVAQMRLDGLLAEEQFRCDLKVVFAVEDEPCHLELALGQRVDARPVTRACARAPMGAVAELPELSLGTVAVPERAARIECRRSAPKLLHGLAALTGVGERSARKRARERALDGRSGVVSRIG